MFRFKHRPLGLESPACNSCNRLTGGHEQFAAMLARVYPNAETMAEAKEFEALMLAVRKQSPLLFGELHASWRQQYDVAGMFGDGFKGGAMNVGGPLVNRSMKMFGAKLTMALHYKSTGTILPAAGGASIRWYTNWDRVRDRIPEELFKFVGSPETLRQGKWSVAEQFEYSWAGDDNGTYGLYISTFRRAFLIAGFVHKDMQELRSVAPQAVIVQPGRWR